MILCSGCELLNPFRVLERAGIREGMHVGDLGCGAIGHFVFPAAQLVGPDGLVYAVDILRDALEIIERRARDEQYANIKCVWSDFDVFRAAHIPDADLDLTLLVNNLYHSQHRTNLVKEMARLTKPGGTVLVVDWLPTATGVGPTLNRRIGPKQAKEIFEVPEFLLTDEFGAGKAHYALVLQRQDHDV